MPSAATVEHVAKQLPPSAAALRLFDWDGRLGVPLRVRRPDIEIVTPLDEGEWHAAADSADAVVGCNIMLNTETLAAAFVVLRPGGRLILIDTRLQVEARLVALLEAAGYTRILVEPSDEGVLMRGEKPHTTPDTHARIESVAQRDAEAGDLAAYTGRFVYLLIRQTPNKPVWALRPDDVIRWDAAALHPAPPMPAALLGFSSLARAVAFLQPAVVDGRVRDIHKVGKFSRATAQTWTQPVLINPPLAVLDGRERVWIAIQPETAELPDE